jgi:hypothetical protein
VSADTGYHYYVSVDDTLSKQKDGSRQRDKKKYKAAEFSDPADAMAMWSAAVTAGSEYVVIEALRGMDYEQPE